MPAFGLENGTTGARIPISVDGRMHSGCAHDVASFLFGTTTASAG